MSITHLHNVHCQFAHLPRLQVFHEYLDEIKDRFTAATYNVMRHNCNHFTEECAHFLVGASIPQHIRDVPQIVMAAPMGAMFAQMFEQAGNNFDPLAGGRRPIGQGALPTTPQLTVDSPQSTHRADFLSALSQASRPAALSTDQLTTSNAASTPSQPTPAPCPVPISLT